MTKNELLSLVNYLTFETDGYAVGAHLCGSTDVNGKISEFKALTGSEPAFIDYDMHSLPFRAQSEIDNAVKQLASFENRGGFITLTSHWLVPSVSLADADEQGASNSRATLTRQQYLDVMTEGTALNANFKAELDIEAAFIKQLSDKNIAVIFRPLHEANGGYFWWGVNEDAGITMADVGDLYIYVYEYFSYTHKLDNILWQFNNSLVSGDNNYDWYPGNEYVDLISVDWYASEEEVSTGESYHIESYYTASQQYGEIAFAVSEFGGDGTYNAYEKPLIEVLGLIEAQISKGVNIGYVGLYFDYNNSDGTLPANAITLDEIAEYK